MAQRGLAVKFEFDSDLLLSDVPISLVSPKKIILHPFQINFRAFYIQNEVQTGEDFAIVGMKIVFLVCIYLNILRKLAYYRSYQREEHPLGPGQRASPEVHRREGGQDWARDRNISNYCNAVVQIETEWSTGHDGCQREI